MLPDGWAWILGHDGVCGLLQILRRGPVFLEGDAVVRGAEHDRAEAGGEGKGRRHGAQPRQAPELPQDQAEDDRDGKAPDVVVPRDPRGGGGGDAEHRVGARPPRGDEDVDADREPQHRERRAPRRRVGAPEEQREAADVGGDRHPAGR